MRIKSCCFLYIFLAKGEIVLQRAQNTLSKQTLEAEAKENNQIIGRS